MSTENRQFHFSPQARVLLRAFSESLWTIHGLLTQALDTAQRERVIGAVARMAAVLEDWAKHDIVNIAFEIDADPADPIVKH